MTMALFIWFRDRLRARVARALRIASPSAGYAPPEDR
jgi:hypothetical protein